MKHRIEMVTKMTPLMQAVYHGQVSRVSAMLKEHACQGGYAVLAEGSTPHPSVFSLVGCYGWRSRTPFLNRLVIMQRLSHKLVAKGDHALMIAIKCGHLAIVKVIVQQAPIALHIVDGQGRNALCVAVAYGHLPIVKWLVTHTDVSLWYFSARSGSPLLLAFLAGHVQIARYCLRVAHQRGQLAKMLDVSMMLPNGHDGLKAYTSLALIVFKTYNKS